MHECVKPVETSPGDDVTGILPNIKELINLAGFWLLQLLCGTITFSQQRYLVIHTGELVATMLSNIYEENMIQ